MALIVFLASIVISAPFTALSAGAGANGAEAGAGAHTTRTRDTAEWTILVYLDADNNLYSYGQEDMDEMKNAGTNSDVNVIVLFDGTSYGDSKYYKIENGEATTLQSLGEVSMSDPQVLQTFLNWGITQYPASRYGLILWDHGDGIYRSGNGTGSASDPSLFKGFCSESGYADIDLDEFRDVLDAVQPQLTWAGGTFDFIGFDLCLLGQVETAYQCMPYADYVIFSEMTEPATGWAYDDSFGALISNPTMTTEALCDRIVDDYYASISSYYSITLSAVDCNALETQFIPALNTLCDELVNQMYNHGSAISDCRSNAETYDQYSYYAPDLFHFVNLIAIDSSLPSFLTSKAQAVLATESSTVIASRHRGSSTGNARGMTVYFPQDSVDQDYYDEIDFTTERWDEFLEEFINPSAAHLSVSCSLVDNDGDGHNDDVQVTVYDTSSQPLEGASVSIDSALAGTTGAGGQLTVDDFAEGLHTVHVSSGGLVANSEFVIANRPPVARFTLPTSAAAKSAVVFDASASTDPDGDPLSFAWDFGDGSTATGERPSHQFDDDGPYEVTLEVFDDNRDTSTITHTYTVLNIPPVAQAGNDQMADEDELVVFDGSASLDTPSDIPTLEYRWSFGDGNGTGWSSSPLANHSYIACGQYTIELTVRDDDGATHTDQLDVAVSNVRPEAVCVDNITVYEDEPITFDGSSSIDSPTDRAQLSYHWDFGDGTEGAGIQTTHTYTDQHHYTVTLTVRDNDLANDYTMIDVYVSNKRPIADAGPDRVVYEDESVQFTASASTDTPSDREHLTYHWTIDDGSMLRGYDGIDAEHVFPRSGTWTVQLTVTDDDDATTTATVNVTVLNVDPEARTADTLLVNEGEPVWLNAENSTDSSSDIPTLRYDWDLDGDGSADDEGATVLHTFDSPGTMTISLTVVDDDGASDTVAVTVTVNAAPHGTIQGPTSVVAGDAHRFSSDQSLDTDGQIVDRYWDLDTETDSDGDGVTDNDRDSTRPNPEVSFPSAGRYTIKLTVIDDRGMAAATEYTVEVDERPNVVLDMLSQPSMTNYGLILYAAIVLVVIILVIVLAIRRRKKRSQLRSQFFDNDEPGAQGPAVQASYEDQYRTLYGDEPPGSYPAPRPGSADGQADGAPTEVPGAAEGASFDDPGWWDGTDMSMSSDDEPHQQQQQQQQQQGVTGAWPTEAGSAADSGTDSDTDMNADWPVDDSWDDLEDNLGSDDWDDDGDTYTHLDATVGPEVDAWGEATATHSSVQNATDNDTAHEDDDDGWTEDWERAWDEADDPW